MNDELKEKEIITPEVWEQDVKAKLNEYIDTLLSMAKDCNMATKYFHPVKDVFETHTDYDTTLLAGAELRIVFNFVENIKKDSINFI